MDYPVYRSNKGLRVRDIKCDRCGREWKTISDSWLLSCTSCGKKVKRPLDDWELENLNKQEENNGKE